MVHMMTERKKKMLGIFKIQKYKRKVITEISMLIFISISRDKTTSVMCYTVRDVLGGMGLVFLESSLQYWRQVMVKNQAHKITCGLGEYKHKMWVVNDKVFNEEERVEPTFGLYVFFIN